jgi:hypothetical protein
MSYQFLTLNDLHLGLRDLVQVRLPTHGELHAVRSYGPRLAARLTEIVASPTAAAGGEPFAVELAETDGVHDGYGGAIWHLTEAVLRAPKVSEALRATLTAVRERFIPELAELKRSHADEAAAAARREPDLAAMKAELKAIPTPDGRTLYDWCANYLRAGKELDAILRRRADVAPTDRSGLGTLRGRCVGMLNRFRAALADELDDDAAQAAAVDAALFAYLDALEARRAAVTAEAEKAAKPVVPAKPDHAPTPVARPSAPPPTH